MQRFKVKSLQKLLIHINILLAFSVLFCSHSAFGQSVKIIVPTLDPMVVDMGFTDVYWSMQNFGAEPGNVVGGYYEQSSSLPGQYSSNTNWRVPSKEEVDSLTDSNKVTIENNNCFKITSKKNGNAIYIPLSGYKYRPNGKFYGTNAAYFWTKDRVSSGIYYSFKGENSSAWLHNAASSVLYKIPFRPVIDKCKITVKILEDGDEIKELI